MVSLRRWVGVALALWVSVGGGAAWAERRAPREAVERLGVVTKVSDGDTFWWRPEQCEEGTRCQPVKVRMLGIDAPERCQPWGEQSTQILRTRLLNQTVRVRTSARDTYGRVLGEVRLDNVDVGAWMVRQGNAWSYRNRRSKGPYFEEEQAARAARAGLFADRDAMDPSRFRKVHGPCKRT